MGGLGTPPPMAKLAGVSKEAFSAINSAITSRYSLPGLKLSVMAAALIICKGIAKTAFAPTAFISLIIICIKSLKVVGVPIFATSPNPESTLP